MNVIRIRLDDDEPTGAKAEGRAFLGAYARVLVLDGSFAGLSAGITIASETGDDLIGFQALDQYGGGRAMAGDVLFDRSYLQHLLDGVKSIPILINVCDSDGNVYASAQVTLYNSSASAV
jgi:hypothetical protein